VFMVSDAELIFDHYQTLIVIYFFVFDGFQCVGYQNIDRVPSDSVLASNHPQSYVAGAVPGPSVFEVTPGATMADTPQTVWQMALPGTVVFKFPFGSRVLSPAKPE
jgi:hypothetical protein